ncbi:MAG: DUF192 domain-containing protein [Patescibacteria group bacterium]
MRVLVFVLLAAVLLLGFTTLILMNGSSSEASTISVKGFPLVVEVADTQEARQKGLSGRPSLEENEGMLFVYKEPERPGFWMKDMNFSLDILWIDEHGVIQEIAESISPDSFPQRFLPETVASYILEVNAGWVERHGIEAGDSVISK